MCLAPVGAGIRTRSDERLARGVRREAQIGDEPRDREHRHREHGPRDGPGCRREAQLQRIRSQDEQRGQREHDRQRQVLHLRAARERLDAGRAPALEGEPLRRAALRQFERAERLRGDAADLDRRLERTAHREAQSGDRADPRGVAAHHDRPQPAVVDGHRREVEPLRLVAGAPDQSHVGIGGQPRDVPLDAGEVRRAQVRPEHDHHGVFARGGSHLQRALGHLDPPARHRHLRSVEGLRRRGRKPRARDVRNEVADEHGDRADRESDRRAIERALDRHRRRPVAVEVLPAVSAPRPPARSATRRRQARAPGPRAASRGRRQARTSRVSQAPARRLRAGR